MDKQEYFYNEQWIPAHAFRVFIYHRDGRKQLVESYERYMFFLETNEWFTTIEEAEKPIAIAPSDETVIQPSELEQAVSQMPKGNNRKKGGA